MCAIMQNVVKIGKKVSEILRFFDFQDCGRRPSSIFELETAKMHHHTKFHQNRRTAAEISHLTFFKMAAVRHLRLFNEKLCYCRGTA